MPIAIISDTHLAGARRLPPECLAPLQEAEAIVHAGDISTVAALRELEAIGPPVHAVAGNVEEPALHDLLPVELEVELAGARIAVLHDAGPARGRLQRLRARFPEAAAVVFGHSHLPLLERDAEGFQIFNPGSPTLRRRAPSRTMGLAQVEGGSPRFEHIELRTS